MPSNARYIRSGRLAGLGLILLAGSFLAGCQQTTPYPTEALAANDYQLRHPIIVDEGTETLDLPVGTGMRRLPPQMAAAVTSFAADGRRRGASVMEINVPSGSANESAVHSITPGLRSAIKRGGFSGKRIVTRSYPVADPGISAPVRLAYPTIKAEVGPCGTWPDDVTGDFANTDYYDFGCATPKNLAATVDDPADFIYPRATGAADQQRRTTVFEKYRRGERTASDYKEGDGASISDAAN